MIILLLIMIIIIIIMIIMMLVMMIISIMMNVMYVAVALVLRMVCKTVDTRRASPCPGGTPSEAAWRDASQSSTTRTYSPYSTPL